MLAQSCPRSLFSSSSGTKRKYSMSMDISPSRLVTLPSRPAPLNIEAANQGAHTSPFDFQALLQAAAQADSEGPAYGVQNLLSSALLAYASQVPGLENPSSEQAITPRAPSSLLIMGENITGSEQRSLGESSTPSSSSLPFANQSQNLVYSRRSSGNASPQSAPVDSSLFYRTANSAARQRTSQACDKCRERKTKCTGNRPICKRCTDRGLKCVWSPDTRVRGPARPRIDVEDNAGGPMAALPFPLSEPVTRDSSPLFKVQDLIHSAPATQSTFSSIPLSANYNNMHPSLHNGMNHPIGMTKGAKAQCIMGEPITALSSVDDCWFPVRNAEVELPSRDRSGTIMPRERGRSVSVAHLARARVLHHGAQPSSEMPTTGFHVQQPGFYYSGESNNESSPSLDNLQLTSSAETSDSEPTLSLLQFHYSNSGEYEQQQPFASYGSSSQLSEEVINLLHFPEGAESAQVFDQGLGSGSFDGVHPLAHLRTHFNSNPTADEVMPLAASQQNSKENADDLVAQYFDAEAFDNMQEKEMISCTA